MGFRTEIDAFVTDVGKVKVVGAIKETIIPKMKLV